MKDNHNKGEGIATFMPLEKWEDSDKQKQYKMLTVMTYFFFQRGTLPHSFFWQCPIYMQT